jgi:TolB protein
MKCSKCNRENDASAGFCSFCGASLTADYSPPQADNWKTSPAGKFVIRYFRTKKKDWIVKKLIADFKLSQMETAQLYENVKTEMVKYFQTSEFRREMSRQGLRKMFFGLLWAVGGLTVTIYSITHPSNEGAFFIFWGAVLYGLIDFFMGLAQWLQYRETKRARAVPGLTPVVPGYSPAESIAENKFYRNLPEWAKLAVIIGGLGIIAAAVIILVAHRMTPSPEPLTSSGGYTPTTYKLAQNDSSLTNGTLANSRIAFVSNQQIWVMNPDGSHLKTITTKAADYQLLEWTPDGSRLGFTSNLNGAYNRYTKNSDGSNMVVGGEGDAIFGISPDDTRQAISKSPDSTNTTIKEIYIHNFRDSSVIQLTHDSAVDDYPLWSPDGSKIAFDSYRDGNRDIYVAFISQRAENNNNQMVYVMNADGSGQKLLSDNPSFTMTWSPDSSKIAYIQDAVSAVGEQICVTNVDGSNKLQLTNTKGVSYLWIAWSPVPKSTH